MCAISLTCPIYAERHLEDRSSGAMLCQVILTPMKVIDVDSLPADPLEALRELSRADVELEALRRERVEAARSQGATWDQIGESLGMSRQLGVGVLRPRNATCVARRVPWLAPNSTKTR